MNYIHIIAPRWHDRTILVADHKIGGINQIGIDHHEFPEPYYMSGDKLQSYPTQIVKSKQGRDILMRVVPLTDLSTDLVLEEL